MLAGLNALAAAIAIAATSIISVGEAFIAVKAIDCIGRNPEAAKELKSNMILAMSLDETCAIYCLLVSILIIFN